MSDCTLGVTYDKTLKLMSVHPSAWALSPLFQWFEDYRIVTNIKNPLDVKFSVVYINDYLQPEEKIPITVRDMNESPALARLVDDLQLKDYKRVVSRPTTTTSEVSYISNDYAVAAKYENKVWLRENFSSELRFPKFTIKSSKELADLDFKELTSYLNATGIILQHPVESGGRGTYIVKTQSELKVAINELKKRIDENQKIVISELLQNIQERSIQVCITEEDILVGPPQAQLVGHPVLTSDIPGSVQFCGGMIADDLLSARLYSEAKSTAKAIAEQLKEAGHRGIFGIDFIVSDEQLYLIEVNARLTGQTALLAFLQKQHPFLLLHILELAGSPYSLQVQEDDPSLTSGSFVLVYAKKDTKITSKTGIYDSNFKYLRLGFEENNIIPSHESEYFVAMKRNFGSIAPAGKSIAFIYSKKRLFNDSGELDAGLIHIASELQK